jgi:hypothetical protein
MDSGPAPFGASRNDDEGIRPGDDAKRRHLINDCAIDFGTPNIARYRKIAGRPAVHRAIERVKAPGPAGLTGQVAATWTWLRFR